MEKYCLLTTAVEALKLKTKTDIKCKMIEAISNFGKSYHKIQFRVKKGDKYEDFSTPVFAFENRGCWMVDNLSIRQLLAPPTKDLFISE
jgi:hypothetical protein